MPMILQEAIEIYKKQYGPCIANDFKVPPSSSFPPYCWGISLGSSLKKLPDSVSSFGVLVGHSKKLESLNRVQVKALLEGILGFIEQTGHIKVPSTYTVPFSDQFLNVGTWIHNVLAAAEIANGSAFSVCLEQAWLRLWTDGSPTAALANAADGLVSLLESSAERVYHSIVNTISISGLVCQIQLAIAKSYSDANVITPGFVVPVCSHYPPECWGLRLGIIAYTNSSTIQHSMKLAELEGTKSNQQFNQCSNNDNSNAKVG